MRTGMFQVGYAKVDVTPEESVPLMGYGATSHRMSNNVLSPLYATCIAFTDECDRTALICTVDLIYGDRASGELLRPAMSQATGVPVEYIMISGPQTHSAPDTANTERESIERYKDLLRQRFVRAAQLAMADRAPARMFITSVETQGLNFVRRYILRDGTPAGDNYGHFERSPIARPESLPDREMQLVKLVREGKKDIIIANFQTHPHRTGGSKKYDVSADIIGVMREKMEAVRGCCFAYFTGGSANINPISKVPEENVYQDFVSHGSAMADYAIGAEETYTEVETGPVRAEKVVLSMPVNHSQDHRAELGAQLYGRYMAGEEKALLHKEAQKAGFNSIYHCVFVKQKAELPEEIEVELNAVGVGSLGFAVAPYEMFDTNGLQIKRGSPFDMTLVLTCANEGTGYVPSRLGFRNGGYSSDSCKFLPGAGEKFADALVGLLNELHDAE